MALNGLFCADVLLSNYSLRFSRMGYFLTSPEQIMARPFGLCSLVLLGPTDTACRPFCPQNLTPNIGSALRASPFASFGPFSRNHNQDVLALWALPFEHCKYPSPNFSRSQMCHARIRPRWVCVYEFTLKDSQSIVEQNWAGLTELLPNFCKSASDYMQELKQNLETVSGYVSDHAANAQEQYAYYYNLRARDKHFDVGDLVIVLSPDYNFTLDWSCYNCNSKEFVQ